MNHKIRRRTAASGAVFLILLLILFALRQKDRESPEMLLDATADKIAAITLLRDGRTEHYERDGAGNWTEGDAASLNKLAAALTGVAGERHVAMDTPADFGLKEPSVRVGVTLTDGREVVLLIGSTNETALRCYAMRGGESDALVISAALPDALASWENGQE